MQPHSDLAALQKSLSWRYATKKFDPARKIPQDLFDGLLRAAQLAPSSYGLQPWKFIVVNDPAVRAKLRPHAWNQAQITDASHLVVFARRSTVTGADVDRLIDRIVEVRKAPREALADYRNMMLGTVNKPGADHSAWNARQTYIALGFFLAAAAVAGVDACPMEGFDPAKFDEILGLGPDGYMSTVVVAAGYRAADDSFASSAKVRFDTKDVVRVV